LNISDSRNTKNSLKQQKQKNIWPCITILLDYRYYIPNIYIMIFNFNFKRFKI
jgi:hypothetical protein